VRSSRSLRIGLVLLAILVIAGIAAPLLAPYSIDERNATGFRAPSSSHWLGLDDGGVDVLSLCIWGLRVSLAVALASAIVSSVVGGLIGIVAGYRGGFVETALMRITDYFIVLPLVPLLILVAALFGASLWHLILIIGLLLWTTTARLVASEVKSLKERPFVIRARAIGASDVQIVRSHIIPHVAPLLIANTVLTVAAAIYAETALSFLGLGDPSSPTLGRMLGNAFARTAVSVGAWWAIVPPAACVAALVVACMLIGRGLEQSANPKLKATHLGARRFTRVPLATRTGGTDA
jgi:peptide/nickel transport system permease protein